MMPLSSANMRIFRARRLGEDPVTAAENAARRMAPPVFSATITTVIAFWGLTLIGGRFWHLNRRHSLYGHRSIAGVFGRMLPDPPQPHEPFVDPRRHNQMVRHPQPPFQPRISAGSATPFSAPYYARRLDLSAILWSQSRSLYC